jgi:glycosidase
MALQHRFSTTLLSLLLCLPASQAHANKEIEEPTATAQKIVVYQVFTRLFGNKQTTNIPWGTAQQNGVGKFNDFDDKALIGIKQLGVSHIWYTGVPHHALVADYTKYGIQNDDPDIIKGRAGSPYAVKDYYNVNPDLAVNPAKRLQEFEALIARSHQHDLKVIIDIVPNHIARHYQSIDKPNAVRDFGQDDNTSVEYARDNNFYYVPGKPFELPVWPADYKVLNGEANPKLDGKFSENPAKWTGNGSRLTQPKFDDWYETVKINYGVKPDGSYDFPRLPADYASKDWQAHYQFWQGKSVPSSWVKFKDITQFWLAKGIDGFRYDMAEMVPVEFWSYLNSHIKHSNPRAFLLAEVYNPKQYRDYLYLGKMDYLYDKVDFYDHLKLVMQGKASTDNLATIQQQYADIEHHLLHFLENHDEQRIASPEFAGNAAIGMPAMLVSATISTAPTLLYFGQEVGEKGEGNPGFGKSSRTTIFDYWGVPAHQRWMNNGKFDGAALTTEEKDLRDFYTQLMTIVRTSPAMMGAYQELHSANKNSKGYDGQLFSFARWSANQKLIMVSNFSATSTKQFSLAVPPTLIADWRLRDGKYTLKDRLGKGKVTLQLLNMQGQIALELAPLQSVILELNL